MSDTITRTEYLTAKQSVEEYKALQRLRNNPDFLTLIESGYIQHKTNELVLQLASVDEGSREQLILYNEIKAVSFFKKYLEDIANTSSSVMDTVTMYESGHMMPENY